MAIGSEVHRTWARGWHYIMLEVHCRQRAAQQGLQGQISTSAPTPTINPPLMQPCRPGVTLPADPLLVPVYCAVELSTPDPAFAFQTDPKLRPSSNPDQPEAPHSKLS
jgi:hypothetical protein